MNLIENSSNIVIAGFWNPRIFNPLWFNKLGIFDKDTIESEISITGSAITFKFKLEKTSLFVSNDKLIITPNSLNDFESAEEIIKKVIVELPHTPVTAIGFNFEFDLETDEASPLFELKVKKDHPNKNQVVACEFTFEGYSLNIGEKIMLDKKALKLNWNFPAIDLEVVKSILETNGFIKILEKSKQFLNTEKG